MARLALPPEGLLKSMPADAIEWLRAMPTGGDWYGEGEKPYDGDAKWSCDVEARSGENAPSDETDSLLLFDMGVDRVYGANRGLATEFVDADAVDADRDIAGEGASGTGLSTPDIELMLALRTLARSAALKWFLMALSGLPGKCLAISAHRDPMRSYKSIIFCSSSGVQSDLMMVGSR